MFLLRSAFWLTVAFVAFHPKDVDLGATASQLSGEAMAAGQRMVVSQLLNRDCPLLTCRATQVAPPNAGPPTGAQVGPGAVALQASPGAPPAPVPRPRPAWMG